MDIFRQNSNTREDLGMLAVMEILEGRQRVTQRELARETGLNLKKVNYCLRKLLQKGYIKFQRARQNPDKRAYLYILTPAGMKAKSQLTYNFIRFTLDFYGKMEQKLLHCLDEISASGIKEVVLYGASDVARVLLDMLDGSNVAIVGVVDGSCRGHDFHGVPVLKVEQLRALNGSSILITFLEDPEKAERDLMRLGIPPDMIWSLS